MTTIDPRAVDLALSGGGAGDTLVRKTAAQTVSAASFTDVTELGVTVEAGAAYLFAFRLGLTVPNGGSNGPAVAVNGPAAATNGLWMRSSVPLSLTGLSIRSMTTYDGGGTGTATFAGSNLPGYADIVGVLVVGATGGTLVPRVLAQGGNTVTVLAGSFGTLRQLTPQSASVGAGSPLSIPSGEFVQGAANAQGYVALTAQELADILGPLLNVSSGGVTQSDLAAHAADTTGVHGFVDTSAVVTNDDTRLVDQRTPLPDSVDATKIASALKPSGSAAATDEALRALGTSGSTAAPGNHTHGGLTADQVAATASVRTLGTGAQQAAAGSHTHSAAAITNVPALEVASNNVQAAINEVAAKTVPQLASVTASTATTTLDLAGARKKYFRVTLTANTTFAFSNVPANVYAEWTVEVAQDATGGRTIAWPASRWDTDTVPAPLTAPSSVTQFEFWSVGGTPYRAAQVLKSTGAV